MLRILASSLLVLSISLAQSACTLPDDMRCPKGYFYVPELLSCCLDSDIFNGMYCEPPEPVDTDPVEDSGMPSDGGEQTGESGIGTTCTSSLDCAAFEANYCAVNPLGPNYCTFENCGSTAIPECPVGYSCCDCTASTMLDKTRACLTDSDAILAQGMANCTCQSD